jgi:hypothetical protein
LIGESPRSGNQELNTEATKEHKVRIPVQSAQNCVEPTPIWDQMG